MADRAQKGRICARGWLPALLALLAILTLAASSFYTSLGGQKVIAENLLEE